MAGTDFFAIIDEISDPSYLDEFELLVLLIVIRLGEEAYGVPISREIKERTGRNVAFATVYSTLERLQRKGLVHSQLGDPSPERGGRAKRDFRITKAGLQAVPDAKRNLARLWRGLRELEGGMG